MADLKIKLKDAVKKTFSFPTGARHKITLVPPKVFVLDVEDAHFNFDRHVLLPDLSSTDGSEAVLDVRRVTGLGVIYAALVHAKSNPSQGLFVSGHTDAAGAATYNQKLSDDRAQNVSLLLRGKRDDWRKLSAQTDAVDDYQTVLLWQHQRAGWDCDPGAITNRLNKATRDAIHAFQERYNQEVEATQSARLDSPFKKKIGVDGSVGAETWGAFYDVYMTELMDLLDLKAFSALAQMQAALKAPPGMKDFVGCGEHIPFNPARRRPFERAKDEHLEGPQKNPPDRRVEILFFDPGEEVDLVCHPEPGTCDPGECPLYIRVPHRQVPIGIPKGLNIAEVNLRLTFVDPEGKVRPFPEGLRSKPSSAIQPDDPGPPPDPDATAPILDDSDGLLDLPEDEAAAEGAKTDASDSDTSKPADDTEPESMEVDQEPTAATGPDGVLQFAIPRKAGSLYLRLVAGFEKRFVTADPKDLADQKLVSEEDAIQAVGKGRVFFRLPAEVNTRQAYFDVQGAPAGVTFKDGAFLNIDNKQTQIGSRESPLELRLGIHWQFLKFEYFDRWTSSLTNVPQPRSAKPDGGAQPPLVMHGFAQLIEADSVDLRPDASTAWDLVSGTNTVHCLAWVAREVVKDQEPRTLPDDKCTAEFNARKLFVRTDGDGSSPDAPRAFVELSFDDPLVKTPGADRLRLYDLPAVWRSRAYPARLEGETPDKARPFENIGATASTRDKPYVFSLDVIVLSSPDDALRPDTSVKWNDSVLANRFTIFDNQLHVYNPDPPAAEPYFTHLADLKPQPSGPVLLDFAPFTRLIARGPHLFDVFDRRTFPFTPFKGTPIGARLAVRLKTDINTTLPMTLSAAPFSSARPTGPSSSSDIGDSRTLVLRCCGHDKTTELFNVLQYISVTFDFARPLDQALKTKFPLLNQAQPMPGPPANAAQLVHDCLTKVADRWNGRDGINKAEATFEIDSPATARGRYAAFLSHGDLKPTDSLAPGDVRISLIRSGRSFMSGNSPEGFWKTDRMVPLSSGVFTGAHETGHIFSQPDEYLNTDDKPSYDMPNIVEQVRSAGTPYGIDSEAMMVSNFQVRTRYFWDLVLFARENGHFGGAKAIFVKHGPRTFTTDITPLAQSRVRFPVAHQQNVDVPPFGLCDLYAYATGEDDFTVGTIGFVVVRVKMAWTVETTDAYDEVSGFITRAFRTIHRRFNETKPLHLNATLHGKTGRVRVIFAPRFVCSTFPTGDGADTYLGSLFPALPKPFQKGDYEKRAEDLVTKHGVHFRVRLAGGTPGVLDHASPRHALIRADRSFLIFSDSRFDDDLIGTFNQMAGLPFTPSGTPADFTSLFAAMSGALAPELSNIKVGL